MCVFVVSGVELLLVSRLTNGRRRRLGLSAASHNGSRLIEFHRPAIFNDAASN